MCYVLRWHNIASFPYPSPAFHCSAQTMQAPAKVIGNLTSPLFDTLMQIFGTCMPKYIYVWYHQRPTRFHLLVSIITEEVYMMLVNFDAKSLYIGNAI